MTDYFWMPVLFYCFDIIDIIELGTGPLVAMMFENHYAEWEY